MDLIFQTLISVLLATLGLYLLFFPTPAAIALSRFYSRYPLVRLAPEKQLVGKPVYLRLLGSVFVLLSSAIFIL